MSRSFSSSRGRCGRRRAGELPHLERAEEQFELLTDRPVAGTERTAVAANHAIAIGEERIAGAIEIFGAAAGETDGDVLRFVVVCQRDGLHFIAVTARTEILRLHVDDDACR